MFPFLALFAAAAALVSSSCSSNDSSTNETQPSETTVPSIPPPAKDEEVLPTPSETESSPPSSPCPEGMVAVDRFCIDRYEASLLVGDQRFPHNQRPKAEQEYRASSEFGVFPQGYISRNESEQACRKSAKRLCTLSEWLGACRGKEKWIYPYGNAEDKSKCNNWKTHLMSQFYKGVDPMTWGYDSHFNNPQLDAEPGFLAKTGEYGGCESPSGVHDMVGNLHEWISDFVDLDLPAKISLKEGLMERLHFDLGHGIFMGGFFSTSNEHGLGCGFITIGHEAAYHDYSTGFRCCADQH